LQAIAFVGAFFYGAAWLFASAFYSRFGVNPEDAGISFDFLFVRASILAGVLGTLTALLLARPDSRGWLKQARHGNARAFAAGLVASVLAAAALWFFSLWAILRYQFEGNKGLMFAIAAALALVAAVIQFVLILLAVGYRADADGGPAADAQLNLKFALLATAFGLVSLLGLSLGSGIVVGNWVHDGNSITNWFVSIPEQRVYLSSSLPNPTDHPPSNSGAVVICGLRLGISGSALLLYEPATEQIYTLSVETAVARQPAGGCT
jgi:hypothetical protein